MYFCAFAHAIFFPPPQNNKLGVDCKDTAGVVSLEKGGSYVLLRHKIKKDTCAAVLLHPITTP